MTDQEATALAERAACPDHRRVEHERRPDGTIKPLAVETPEPSAQPLVFGEGPRPERAARNKCGTGYTFSKRGKQLPKRDIPAALDAHARAQAASDKLRNAAGLPPVPENSVVRAWRERAPKAKPTAQTRKPKKAQPKGDAPMSESTNGTAKVITPGGMPVAVSTDVETPKQKAPSEATVFYCAAPSCSSVAIDGTQYCGAHAYRDPANADKVEAWVQGKGDLPAETPKPKPIQVKDPDAPRTAKQVYAIAARALTALGYTFPATKGEASELIQELDGLKVGE